MSLKFDILKKIKDKKISLREAIEEVEEYAIYKDKHNIYTFLEKDKQFTKILLKKTIENKNIEFRNLTDNQKSRILNKSLTTKQSIKNAVNLIAEDFNKSGNQLKYADNHNISIRKNTGIIALTDRQRIIPLAKFHNIKSFRKSKTFQAGLLKTEYNKNIVKKANQAIAAIRRLLDKKMTGEKIGNVFFENKYIPPSLQAALIAAGIIDETTPNDATALYTILANSKDEIEAVYSKNTLNNLKTIVNQAAKQQIQGINIFDSFQH
jgi:hypothetical protein